MFIEEFAVEQLSEYLIDISRYGPNMTKSIQLQTGFQINVDRRINAI